MIRYYVWDNIDNDYVESWSKTVLFKTLEGAETLLARLFEYTNKTNLEIRKIDLSTGTKV